MINPPPQLLVLLRVVPIQQAPVDQARRQEVVVAGKYNRLCEIASSLLNRLSEAAQTPVLSSVCTLISECTLALEPLPQVVSLEA